MSSSRERISLTGRPTAFDACTACTTKSGTILRPKLPPRNVTCTVTFSAEQPAACATASWQALTDWIGPHTSTAPSR